MGRDRMGEVWPRPFLLRYSAWHSVDRLRKARRHRERQAWREDVRRGRDPEPPRRRVVWKYR
jgi:hypothetical protein